MKKAVIYARVSSERQEREGYSIPAQIKYAQEYAKRTGIEVVASFVEAETAKRSGRIEFGRMLNFLKKNTTVRAILVEKTDRLYRNLKDYVLIDEIDNIEIHFYKEGQILSESSRSQDKFMHGIRVLMAKNYIDNLSEEIRKGLTEKCEQGYYPSALPIGYVNSDVTGRKEIVLTQDAIFIKQIFEKYLMGNYTYRSLAEEMDGEGFTPKGRKCSNKTIENILHNEFYTGIFYYRGKKYYNAKHPAIITSETYMRVQEKMENRYKIAPKKHKLAYSGFIKCGKCGRALIGEIQHGSSNSGNYVYYRCHHCKGVSIREDKFEDMFYNEVLLRLDMPAEIEPKIIEIAKELIMDENSYAESSMSELHGRIQKLKRRLAQLYTDRCDGIVGDEIFVTKQNEWQKELDKALVEYEKINEASDKFIIKLGDLSNTCKNAPQYYLSQPQEKKREIMNLLMSNPIFDGSNLVMPIHPAFKHIAKLNKLVMVGVVKG